MSKIRPGAAPSKWQHTRVLPLGVCKQATVGRRELDCSAFGSHPQVNALRRSRCADRGSQAALRPGEHIVRATGAPKKLAVGADELGMYDMFMAVGFVANLEAGAPSSVRAQAPGQCRG